MKEWTELTLNEQQQYLQQVSKMIESGLVDESINPNELAKDLYESSEYSMLTE